MRMTLKNEGNSFLVADTVNLPIAREPFLVLRRIYEKPKKKPSQPFPLSLCGNEPIFPGYHIAHKPDQTFGRKHLPVFVSVRLANSPQMAKKMLATISNNALNCFMPDPELLGLDKGELDPKEIQRIFEREEEITFTLQGKKVEAKMCRAKMGFQHEGKNIEVWTVTLVPATS